MWTKITATVSADAAPGIADVMLSFTRGVEEQPGAAGVRLVAYLPATGDSERAVTRIRERIDVLRMAGVDVGQGTITRRRVRSQVWEEVWKAGFEVIRVPPRLVVKPTWRDYVPQVGEAVVELDPGMAFGTGQHATTRACLAALAGAVRQGAVAFDIGTGSGILAIAAAKLGARRVVAVELDESAARIARDNVALNGVATAVAVIHGNGLRCLRGAADVIVANLTAEQIAGMAREVPARLRPAGVFIAAGISSDQETDVRKAAFAAGLVLRESQRDDDWVTMTWEVETDATAAG